MLTLVVGKFYLADARYATWPGILPPYREVRYHLKEFHGAQDPKCPKELFNHRHSQLRTTVERAFGALKNCFKILSNKPFIPLKSQAKVVIACCALHNWILTMDLMSSYMMSQLGTITYQGVRIVSPIDRLMYVSGLRSVIQLPNRCGMIDLITMLSMTIS